MGVRFEDLTVGAAPAKLTIGPVSRTDIVRYQGASGDMNPVHHDEPFAQGAGFAAPLGVGMYPAGVMHAWLAGWVGPEHVRRCRTRWRAAYFPGDTLSFEGRVTALTATDGGGECEIEATCTNQAGAVTMQGWLTARWGEPGL
ncbi:MAG: MaoC family dehydratase [Myxococcales bacterium]|nr:MaoC family dehydratase [Myxococcales bacterium]MCB9532373.1 MaoC family dehydratase [Myxococcales bacterium]